MPTEDLMMPRYKVVADFPGSDFEINQIIELNDKDENDNCVWKCGDWWFEKNFNQYPHLFKKLEWWEDREKGEMPEYVKVKKPNTEEWTVFKIGKTVKFARNGNNDVFGVEYLNSGGGTLISYVLPATEDDYNKNDL